MRNVLIPTLLACLLVSAQSTADEIRVKIDTIRFDAEDKQDDQSRVCGLMTMIVDQSRPEALNFRVIHTISPKSLFFGFSLDVGDIHYQNGLYAGLDKIILASGDVSTGAFNSQGRMYGGQTSDGGVLKSTMDEETARMLWLGVLSGDFSIHLLRATPGAEPRTYVISTAPSPDALSKYLACSVEIRDIALGKLASPDFYAKVRHGGPGFTEPMRTSQLGTIPPLSEEGPLVGKR